MDWPAPGRYSFDKTSSVARVYTFKAGGLASGLAHDLELVTSDFDGHVEISDDGSATVEARIDLWSLEVDEPLTGMQKREAEKTMRKKVLEKRDEAYAVFEGKASSDAGDASVRGTLSLIGGKAREIELAVEIGAVDESSFEASTRYENTQSRFGIKPFKAMMGMLKLEDRFVVEIDATLKK